MTGNKPSKLNVVIQQYKPNVTCFNTPKTPIQASCNSVLSLMPASRDRVAFSTSPTAGEVRVPHHIYPRELSPFANSLSDSNARVRCTD